MYLEKWFVSFINCMFNILFDTKMTYLFCKFRIVDMLYVWLNKKSDNFDWIKFVWLRFYLMYIM